MSVSRKLVMKFARQILTRESLSKLEGVQGEEFFEAAKYSIISSLEKEYHHLAKNFKIVEKGYHDLAHARIRLIMIPSKIKMFEQTFNEEDFNKVMGLFSSVRKEIENAESI